MYVCSTISSPCRRLLAAAFSLLLAMSVSSGCSFSARNQNAQGTALYMQGQYQPAMQHFQEAIAADPSNPDGYYNLAATYQQRAKLTKSQDDLDQAEHYYNQCLDRDVHGTHRDCYRGLAVLLCEEGRNDEAFRLLERWADRNPSQAAPKIELARLSEEFGKYDVAQTQLQDALVIEPKNPRALAALGRLRERSGDPQQALANYQRSLWHDRAQPDVAARISSLQSALNPATLTAPQSNTRMVNVDPASTRQ